MICCTGRISISLEQIFWIYNLTQINIFRFFELYTCTREANVTTEVHLWRNGVLNISHIKELMNITEVTFSNFHKLYKNRDVKCPDLSNRNAEKLCLFPRLHLDCQLYHDDAGSSRPNLNHEPAPVPDNQEEFHQDQSDVKTEKGPEGGHAPHHCCCSLHWL